MENTNFYNEQNLIEIKNTSRHKKGQIAVAPIEAVAFFMIASASLVNNSTNYVNPKPKQQIIQNVQEKGDVGMSNNKDTSTQEVRQKDVDNVKELIKEQINTVNANINTIRVTENLHYKELNSDVKDVKKSIDSIKKEAVDYAKQISDEQIAKSAHRAVIISAVIGVIGTIISAIIGKLL